MAAQLRPDQAMLAVEVVGPGAEAPDLSWAHVTIETRTGGRLGLDRATETIRADRDRHGGP